MEKFNQFYKETDLRSRTKMIDFLQNHFRYDLLNSWNRTTSYANNIKIHNLGIDSNTKDKLFELLNVDEAYEIGHNILRNFMYDHDGLYQIGRNGRSGGYLVLYAGQKRVSDYRSYCPICGQRNYQLATDTNRKCGNCGENTRINYTKPLYEYITLFQGIDQNADFNEWSMEDLKYRVKLVQEFDKTCDDYINTMINLAKNCEIIEETVYVPKTRSILISKKNKE